MIVVGSVLISLFLVLVCYSLTLTAKRADENLLMICEQNQKIEEEKGKQEMESKRDILRVIEKELKKGSDSIPVILLTANYTDLDIVNGLELGADDYITKPFSLAVLRARVNTQLRKTTPCDKKNVITIDDYSFDFSTMEFSIRNKKVELSKTEQKLLRLLIENRGTVMSRSALVDRIWTDGAEYVDENALSVTVKRLRDKLKAHSYIKTIYGIGYSWVNEP